MQASVLFRVFRNIYGIQRGLRHIREHAHRAYRQTQDPFQRRPHQQQPLPRYFKKLTAFLHYSGFSCSQDHFKELVFMLIPPGLFYNKETILNEPASTVTFILCGVSDKILFLE